MKDKQLINEREVVFDQFRKSTKELHTIKNKYSEILAEMSSRRNEVEGLKKLIDIMLEHDCCPVEAKLKYGEQLQERRHAEADTAIDTVKGRY